MLKSRKRFMKNLKTILTGKLFFIILIIIAYITGTFQPNFLKVKQLKYQIEEQYIEEAKYIGMYEPEFIYDNNKQFISALTTCINFINFGLHYDERIPKELIIAQAVLESNYGKSRFAVEGNNLFGIRTWNLKEPHIVPFKTTDTTFGIKKFKTKCKCVRHYIKLLNNSSAFHEFRKVRKRMLDNNYVDVLILTNYISKFATDKEYVSKVRNTIIKLRK